MRFLHTSDWHLGRTLGGHSRREEQVAFLEWFCELVERESVDAVVIAGDVYDGPVPRDDSLRMLNDTLVRLRSTCPVVLIPGNHDQATRLGFASELLVPSRIHIRATREQSGDPVSIEGADGAVVDIYGLPYLDPDIERHALGADRSHEDVLRKAMDVIRDQIDRRGSRSVVMAHAFITGGSTSESERDLRVGGVGDAPADVFTGVDYVALGHLHGAQSISTLGSSTVVEYSGSPLAYSFSEEAHVKSVTLVDFPAVGPAVIERIPIPIRYPLVTLRGTLEQLRTSADLDAHADSWVRIRYTDERAIPNALGIMTSRFNRIAVFEHRPERGEEAAVAPDGVTGAMPEDPIEVLSGFFAYATQSAVTEPEVGLLREVYETARMKAAP